MIINLKILSSFCKFSMSKIIHTPVFTLFFLRQNKL